MSKEEFIEKSKILYGDKYDYSHVEYINDNKKVSIYCKIHKEFFTKSPKAHLEGSRCKKCLYDSLKLTNEQFIEKARAIHGYKYDYTKVNYEKSQIKVEIICPTHGSFFQIPNSHLSGSGCIKCGNINKSESQKHTIEEFIDRAKQMHGESYDYSLVEYENTDKKVNIICKKHNIIFSQSPYGHLTGSGCPECRYEKTAKSNTKNTNWFIEKAILKHGDKYDYSKVDYKNAKTKVIIGCKTHGDFEQTPNSHLQGRGCEKCGHELSKEKIKVSFEDFVRRGQELFGEKFLYDESSFKSLNDKITLTCIKHSHKFSTNSNKHITRLSDLDKEAYFKKHSRCKFCKDEYKNEVMLQNKENFIKKSKELYGDKYNYDSIEYKSSICKVKIICPEHGEFMQTPVEHLKRPCPICRLKNTIFNDAPEFVKYFKNVEHSKMYSVKSNKKVELSCPICGVDRTSTVNDLVTNGFKCKVCSSGVSIPEKLFICVLKKLKIEFIHQFSDVWTEGKRYDFFLPTKNLIVEIHGGFHYQDTIFSKKNDVQANDFFKKKLAFENGVQSYFEINCSKSKLNYLKDNIKKILHESIELSDYDWDTMWSQCHTEDLNLILDLWNKGNTTTKKICEKSNISRYRVIRVLKILADLNLCEYNSKIGKGDKSVYKYDKDLNFIKKYTYVKLAEKDCGLKASSITACARGVSKSSGGFIWSYEPLHEVNVEEDYNDKI